jgi:hypothetical protein
MELLWPIKRRMDKVVPAGLLLRGLLLRYQVIELAVARMLVALGTSVRFLSKVSGSLAFGVCLFLVLVLLILRWVFPHYVAW